MRKLYVSMVAAGLAVAAGCSGGSVGYQETNPPPKEMSNRPVNEVKVISTGEPSSKFIEVGIITVAAKPNETVDAVHQRMRQRAALEGCDAVVVKEQSGKNHSAGCIVYWSGPLPERAPRGSMGGGSGW